MVGTASKIWLKEETTTGRTEEEKEGDGVDSKGEEEDSKREGDAEKGDDDALALGDVDQRFGSEVVVGADGGDLVISVWLGEKGSAVLGGGGGDAVADGGRRKGLAGLITSLWMGPGEEAGGPTPLLRSPTRFFRLLFGLSPIMKGRKILCSRDEALAALLRLPPGPLRFLRLRRIERRSRPAASSSSKSSFAEAANTLPVLGSCCCWNPCPRLNPPDCLAGLICSGSSLDSCSSVFPSKILALLSLWLLPAPPLLPRPPEKSEMAL